MLHITKMVCMTVSSCILSYTAFLVICSIKVCVLHMYQDLWCGFDITEYRLILCILDGSQAARHNM